MRTAAIAAAVVAFLAVSAGLARVLGAAGSARGVVVDAVERRAGGGDVEILRVDGIARFAPGERTETARVAWRKGERLPVVQCVRIRRSGDPLSGYDTDVLDVSAPIGREADCPG